MKIQYKTLFNGWIDVTREQAQRIKKHLYAGATTRKSIHTHAIEKRFRDVKEMVGDTVYFAHRFECRITEHKVENLYMGKRGMSIRVENLANPLKPYEIGKTVFLTKEEAEQALRKEDKGK